MYPRKLAGVPVTKITSTFAPVNIPNTEDWRISDNTLLAAYGAQIFQPSNCVAKITYTKRVRGSQNLSNFCIHSSVKRSSSYHGALTYNRNSVAAPTIRTVDHLYGIQMNDALTTAVANAKTAFGVSTGSSLISSQGQALFDSVFDRMRPDLTEVSVPNFILDFAQIKMLLKVWSGRRGIVSNVASANLNLQYGWLPSIDDAFAMVNCIRALQSKIHAWNKRLGKMTSKSAVCLSDSINKTGSFVHFTNPTATCNWTGTVTRRAVAHIKYIPCRIEALNGLDILLRGSLDSLGFELNPGIVWDAIPFSFVVDWFVNIGSYLNSLKIDTLELPIRLADTFLQYKEQLSVDARMTRVADTNNPFKDYGGAMHSETFFQRALIGPSYSFMKSIGWKIPKINQVGLALSLGLSRR